MKLAYSWLKQWINAPLNETQLAEQLTLAGLETTVIPSKLVAFQGVVVGKIIQVDPHPHADRLQICTVDCGTSHTPKTIVCGATNVRQGLKVATALIGAILPNGLHIKPRTIRHIESQGMLCSLTELGLQDVFIKEGTALGIWELSETLSLGVDLWDQLGYGESILDIQVPPNRGDCLSVMGIARELSFLNQLEFTAPIPPEKEEAIQDQLSIQLHDPFACPRYTGRIIHSLNAKVKTPWWILKRLHQGGMRSINAIVDITNYVLLEWGAPLHAFDLAKLSGPLEVRRAHEEESLHLLNDKTVILHKETLVVADKTGPLALAGIMGGMMTSVTDSTVDVFLESAFFNPVAMMGQARQYGLSTESSYRFERGVDPMLCQQALMCVTELLLTICGGKTGPIVKIEEPEQLPKSREIILHQSHIKKLLGIELPTEKITQQLTHLGAVKIMAPENSDPSSIRWHVQIPSWRFDLIEAVDLIEELVRLSGYDRLPTTVPVFPVRFQPIHNPQQMLEKLRQFLVAQSYVEVINYSFIAAHHQKLLDPYTTPVELENPISSELNVLRTQLWAGLLTTLRHNQNHRRQSYQFFESGTVFIKTSEKIMEYLHIGGILTGNLLPEQWATASCKIDFFDAKQIVHNSLQHLDIHGSYDYKSGTHPALDPSKSSQITKDGQVIGWLGALHPSLYNEFDVTPPIYLFEWRLPQSLPDKVSSFQPFSRFPYMRRDIAFWINKDIPFTSIQHTIQQTAGKYLQELTLFDVYQPKDNTNQRSLALGLIWQHPTKTLTDIEIEVWKTQVINSLQQTWNIQLRE